MLTRRRLFAIVFLTLTAPVAGLALAWPLADAPAAPTPLATPALASAVAVQPEPVPEPLEIVPLQLDGPLAHGSWAWNDDGVPEGPITIAVDIGKETISVFRGRYEIGAAAITYGAYENVSPLGEFEVIWKKADHRSSIYDAPMPFTLRLTDDGIAIHGADVSYGKATNGCIGVPVEFAQLLFEQAKLGDRVSIMRSERPA